MNTDNKITIQNLINSMKKIPKTIDTNDIGSINELCIVPMPLITKGHYISQNICNDISKKVLYKMLKESFKSGNKEEIKSINKIKDTINDLKEFSYYEK